MEKNLQPEDVFPELAKRLDTALGADGNLSSIMKGFFKSCLSIMQKQGTLIPSSLPILFQFIDLVAKQVHHPHLFSHYHLQERSPVDLYRFGIDFIRLIVDTKHSSLEGISHLIAIEEQLAAGDNVVFFANHQTEADPQMISLLLEPRFEKLAREMIFVAGDRVLKDPIAVPFSRGRNLLCIYSKRYFDQINSKEEILRHNQKTMQKMCELMKEGSKAIYVAPSGGRDRKNSHGEIEIAPFDPQSIEMFLLMAQRSGKPCHFYPLSLSTYAILPPPQTIVAQLGEERWTEGGAIHIAFGPKLNLETLLDPTLPTKEERRQKRAQRIWEEVKSLYR